MTATEKAKKESLKRSPIFVKLGSLVMLCLIVCFAAFLSEEAAEYVIYGLKLSIERVIPTAFPFMILTEAYTAYARPENLRALSFAFTRLFGIGKAGLRPFICGNIAGFPLGARTVASMYGEGALTKNEAERLLALTSNPSLPFMLGAVGVGMLGSVRLGAYLAISVYLSAVITGILFKGKCSDKKIPSAVHFTPFSLTKSISESGKSCVGICSFITFFSIPCGLVEKRISSKGVAVLIKSLLEVTGGVYSASAFYPSFPHLSLQLCAFALGFGGLSVLMQTSYFKKDTDLSIKTYFLMKLTQGLLSSGIISLFLLMK